MQQIPPTPEELAAEAREALRKVPPKRGQELFVELVRKGFINALGQVTRLIGGSAEPEPNSGIRAADNNSLIKKKKAQ